MDSNMKKIFYMLLPTIVIFSSNVSAAFPARHCNGNISLTGPTDINITGKNVGDTLGDINVNVNVSCDKQEWDEQYLYLGTNVGVFPNGEAHAIKLHAETDQTGSVLVSQTSPTAYGFTLASDYIFGGGNGHRLQITYHPITITLKNKKPGVTIVDFGSMFKKLYSFYGWSYFWEPSNVTLSIPAPLKITYVASCKASLENIAFPGSPTASDIIKGVSPQKGNIRIDCDGALPSYTIKISSPKGSHGSPINGIINSDNTTVGYQLTWADNQISTGNVQLDSILRPTRLPTNASFVIPINVRPVSLVNNIKDIISGPANSTLRVDLKFN